MTKPLPLPPGRAAEPLYGSMRSDGDNWLTPLITKARSLPEPPDLPPAEQRTFDRWQAARARVSRRRLEILPETWLGGAIQRDLVFPHAFNTAALAWSSARLALTPTPSTRAMLANPIARPGERPVDVLFGSTPPSINELYSPRVVRHLNFNNHDTGYALGRAVASHWLEQSPGAREALLAKIMRATGQPGPLQPQRRALTTMVAMVFSEQLNNPSTHQGTPLEEGATREQMGRHLRQLGAVLTAP